jgi:hypothetical protein
MLQPLSVYRSHEHRYLGHRRTLLTRPAVAESRRAPHRSKALPTVAPDPDKPYRHSQKPPCPIVSQNGSDELLTNPMTMLRKSHQRHAKDNLRYIRRELPIHSITKFCSQSIIIQNNERYIRRNEQVKDSQS